MARKTEQTCGDFSTAVADLSQAFSNLQAGFERLQDSLPQPVRVRVSTTADVIGSVQDIDQNNVPSGSNLDFKDSTSRRLPAAQPLSSSLPATTVHQLRNALSLDNPAALIAAIRAAYYAIGPADEVEEPSTPPRSPISISSEEDEAPSAAQASANASASGAAAMASASYRGRQVTAVSAPPPTPVNTAPGSSHGVVIPTPNEPSSHEVVIPTPDELVARLATALERGDYYVVSAGITPGIYRSWLATSSNVNRISCAKYVLKNTKSKALQLYTEEYEAGRVEAIP